jgi:lipopolysaccharide transport system ATP-binding protein
MAGPAIIFDHVWKKFRRGERHDSLRDLVPSAVKRMLGRGQGADLQEKEFWAVRDVSFVVNQGEALGIIGPNGAGKSTTLKLLTKILRPTRGHCEIRGRAGALIEVTSGFHPDLTGRENIFLQGAIMGMKQTEITKKLDAIIDFAGITDFIDTPVKRYSSGMNARLGFAIAAHLDPDVLIIDEVLSVGDMSFQAKCLERMRQNVAAGVSLAFVSHNLQAVAALCRRTIVLGRGGLLFDGPTDQAMQVYMTASQVASGRHGSTGQAFRMRQASLEWPDIEPGQPIPPHSRGVLTAEIDCLEDVDDFVVGLEVERSRDFLYCYALTTDELHYPRYTCRAGDVIAVRMEFDAHLTRGHYRLNVYTWLPKTMSHLFISEGAAQFTITEHQSNDGVTDISPRVSVEVVTPARTVPAAPEPLAPAVAVATTAGRS